MEQLERLEAKVSEIISKYEALKNENESMRDLVKELEENNLKLEESLLDKSNEVRSLQSERESARTAIGELVGSLDVLVATEQ